MLYALTFPLIAVAAGANEDATVLVPAKSRIVSATFSPIAASAANDTNYATLTLTANNGAGGSFTNLAPALSTTTTGTGSLAVGTKLSFAVSAGAEILNADSIVKLAKTFAGSGVAVEGTVTLLLEKVA